MREGKQMGIFKRDEFDQETIIEAAMGQARTTAEVIS
jgi:hypothetical protein